MNQRDIVAFLATEDHAGAVGTVRFDAEELRHGKERETVMETVTGATRISLYRGEADAPDVRRVKISWDGGEIDLLPTKGLSIGRYKHGEWEPFWEPVRPGLISPDAENLLGPVLVHGEPVQSLRWLENFAGCVELLGLSNWGMPLPEKGSDTVLPLHGEASHIPISEMRVSVGQREVVIRGSFTLNPEWWKEPESGTPWYQRGGAAWQVERTILLRLDTPAMEFVDSLTNLTGQPVTPDWGYHLQFRAEPGAELVIPSREVSSRFGGVVEDAFQTWKPAEKLGERVERGYIHKGLETEESPLGTPVVAGSARYPSGPNTRFLMPVAAYTLSWFSCGGKGSLEFALPESPQDSLIPVPWNGMGPEIGASALDHDGNVDPAVVHAPVEPGKACRLYFRIEAE